jgi:hypothetical protein
LCTLKHATVHRMSSVAGARHCLASIHHSVRISPELAVCRSPVPGESFRPYQQGGRAGSGAALSQGPVHRANKLNGAGVLDVQDGQPSSTGFGQPASGRISHVAVPSFSR